MNRGGSARLPLLGRETRRVRRPTSPARRKPRPPPPRRCRRRRRLGPAGAPGRTARSEGRGDQFPPCRQYTAGPIQVARIPGGVGEDQQSGIASILFREEGDDRSRRSKLATRQEEEHKRETGGTS